MKKLFLILSIVFIILTFCGAGYVLYNGGRVNAGYAVIPMVFSLASIVAYRSRKNGKVKIIKGSDGPTAIYYPNKKNSNL